MDSEKAFPIHQFQTDQTHTHTKYVKKSDGALGLFVTLPKIDQLIFHLAPPFSDYETVEWTHSEESLLFDECTLLPLSWDSFFSRMSVGSESCIKFGYLWVSMAIGHSSAIMIWRSTARMHHSMFDVSRAWPNAFQASENSIILFNSTLEKYRVHPGWWREKIDPQWISRFWHWILVNPIEQHLTGDNNNKAHLIKWCK